MKVEDSEASAHTADVMRMLLMCALDPIVHSSEKPNVREYVEASARRLLSELSEAPPDPSLPNSDVKPKRKSVNLNKSQYYQSIEMKKGDWMCSKCNLMNFARNILCLKCKEDGPKLVSHNSAEMKKGDWTCPKYFWPINIFEKICGKSFRKAPGGHLLFGPPVWIRGTPMTHLKAAAKGTPTLDRVRPSFFTNSNFKSGGKTNQHACRLGFAFLGRFKEIQSRIFVGLDFLEHNRVGICD